MQRCNCPVGRSPESEAAALPTAGNQTQISSWDEIILSQGDRDLEHKPGLFSCCEFPAQEGPSAQPQHTSLRISLTDLAQ